MIEQERNRASGTLENGRSTRCLSEQPKTMRLSNHMPSRVLIYKVFSGMNRKVSPSFGSAINNCDKCSVNDIFKSGVWAENQFPCQEAG